jgi:hypothetical protein
VIFEITDKEIVDITNRLETSKKILVKRIIHNESMRETREKVINTMEHSIYEMEKEKKDNYKEEQRKL